MNNNTDQKCCPIHDNTHYCRFKVPNQPNSSCACICTCHTEQKGWREGYWDIFLQEFEMSDFARFAVKKEIERALTAQREEMVRRVAAQKGNYTCAHCDSAGYDDALNTAIALIKDTKI